MEYAIIVLELAILSYVCWLQIKNWKGSKKSLNKIKRTANLSIFNPPNLPTVSDALLNQFDRKIEFPLDKIQSFSNAALVTGIGGTMALFLCEAFLIGGYVVIEDGLPEPLWTIFIGLFLALLSSLIGVVFHLKITSKILSSAHQVISSKENEILAAQENIDPKSPESELSKQLEELTKAWSEADAADLFEMIPQFLEGQTKVMQRMQDNFEKDQNTTKVVIQSQKELIHKVDGILSELNEGHQTHQKATTKIFAGLEDQQKTVSNSLEKLISERESLTREVKCLPENIMNALDVKTINEIFGRQAMNYVIEMKGAFENTLDKLKTELDQYQRELTIKLVEENDKTIEFFGKLEKEIVNDVVDPLGKVADQLAETVNAIPKFGENLLKSVESLSGIPEKLEETGKNINDVVRSTATEALAPVSEKMAHYIDTVNETHQRLEKIIHGLVKLIREMIQDIELDKS